MKFLTIFPASSLALTTLALSLMVSQRADAQTFQTNTPMHSARGYHSATLLQSGKVLLVGGFDSNTHVITNAETFDPSSGTWTAIAGLHMARAAHTATLLADGQVLIAGGGNSGALTNSEIFNPISGAWAVTNGMRYPRYYFTATLLLNVKVLVA